MAKAPGFQNPERENPHHFLPRLGPADQGTGGDGEDVGEAVVLLAVSRRGSSISVKKVVIGPGRHIRGSSGMAAQRVA